MVPWYLDDVIDYVTATGGLFFIAKLAVGQYYLRFLKLLEPTNMLRKYAQEENSLLLNRSNMKEMMIHYES